MISGIDHIVLICPDIGAGITAYETITGRPADWQSSNAVDGTASALFRVENTALELLAPSGEGPVGDRIRAQLDAAGMGLVSIAFSAPDIDEAHRVLTRRGLSPSEITEGAGEDAASGLALTWRRFRCDDAAMAGVRTFVITERTAGLPAPSASPDAVSSLDHFVIGTPNVDRAAAIYGARFGLRLALDRREPRWNTHFLFFRTGGLTLEIVKRLDQDADPAGPDRYFGLTWETCDLQATHARLAAKGLDVSEVRTGRKPGSEVFTLREGTLGVPTLFIAHAPR